MDSGGNTMMTPTATYLDAIEHLPAGGTLILPDVSWEDYEQLLTELGEGYGVRVNYDQGRLEIMSPSAKHEKYKELIAYLARAIADETGRDLESFGSTTFKQQRSAKGAEPDTCFYIQHAAQVAGKDLIDLSADPPPDIIVEVDVAHSSLGKFAFYARLGVPEIWRYDEQQAHIYHLTEQDYAEAEASRAFPFLTRAALSHFLARSKAEGQSAILRSFRQWVRAHRPAP
jgi:Uma2 family endonuclease